MKDVIEIEDNSADEQDVERIVGELEGFIEEAILLYTGLDGHELRSKKRSRKFVEIRQIASKIYRDNGRTFPYITKKMNRSSHRSAVYFIETHERDVKYNDEYKKLYEKVHAYVQKSIDS